MSLEQNKAIVLQLPTKLITGRNLGTKGNDCPDIVFLLGSVIRSSDDFF